jgi:hypothetical protein
MAVSSGALVATAISQAQDAVGTVMQQLQKLFMVLIALKLIQRVDSLNKLFKLVVYVLSALGSRMVLTLRSASLPTILSLLGLWLILFFFFSIMFIEVFGLTKWQSSETHTQNYSSMGSAMVMLSFMSVGCGVFVLSDDCLLIRVSGRGGMLTCTTSQCDDRLAICSLTSSFQCLGLPSLYELYASRLRLRLRERGLGVHPVHRMELAQHGAYTSARSTTSMTRRHAVYLRQHVHWYVHVMDP